MKTENIYMGLSTKIPGQLPPGSIYFCSDTGAQYVYPNGIKTNVEFHYNDFSVTSDPRYPGEFVLERPDGIVRNEYGNLVYSRDGNYGYDGSYPASANAGDVYVVDQFLGELGGVTYNSQYLVKVTGITNAAQFDKPIVIGLEDTGYAEAIQYKTTYFGPPIGVTTGFSAGPIYIGTDGVLTQTAPIAAGNNVIKVGTFIPGTGNSGANSDRLSIDTRGAAIIRTDATKATHINGIPLS